jgi:hypothetical protein
VGRDDAAVIEPDGAAAVAQGMTVVDVDRGELRAG